METSAKYISLGPADYRKIVSIQFGSRPPRFMGVFSTEMAPQKVLVMEHEVKALLKKGAIEYVPHSNRETGFYSRFFIVPNMDGGLRPILDLRVLNILPRIHPSVSQEVPEIHFWGQSIPISGSSVQPSIITPHFREMRRCSSGAS